VRSYRTYARIRSLTTGTFNRVVKDRIAGRLSGANSVQSETHKCAFDRPRNLTNIRCGAKPCQRGRFTTFPRVFHSLTDCRHAAICVFRWAAFEKWRWLYQQNRAQLFRHAQAKDLKIEKRTFGGPCFEGTLQKLLFLMESGFRIQSRGRDKLRRSLLVLS
jgi:hypothetical protein